MPAGVRVNVGCGASPTQGWVNIDNSLTVRLGARPSLTRALYWAGVIDSNQVAFAGKVREAGIRPADASGGLPFADCSVDVVYSSHMVEHLDRNETQAFLGECHRVLRPAGVLRLALPDLRRLVEGYLQSGDADLLIEQTRLGHSRPRGVKARLVEMLFGNRRHRWMYDERSTVRLLQTAGFDGVVGLPAGETTIANPGLLDLRERDDESLYVEGRLPAQ